MRSAFVTAVAWIFVALAGFATLISLLQNIMLNLFFPMEEMRAATEGIKGEKDVPAFAKFMAENFRYIFAFFLLQMREMGAELILIDEIRTGK